MSRSLLVLVLLPLASAFAQTPWPPQGIQEYLVPVAPQESLRVTIAGSGETVVLVPGLFGSAFGYRHLLEMLPAAGFRTIVIEPLGIGRSPRPKRASYSLTAQADRLDAVLGSLNEPPAIVVGHSLGASMALRLAYRHPGRVRALMGAGRAGAPLSGGDGGLSGCLLENLSRLRHPASDVRCATRLGSGGSAASRGFDLK